MHCCSCVLAAHADEPLHVLEVWSGSQFHKVTLSWLGLRFQLGHPCGQTCPFAWPGHKDFHVIHTNGIHPINIDFCGCNIAYSSFQQLIDFAWFLATPLEPQTCAMNVVLCQFHALNLQGNLSGYDFYRSLIYLTDGMGLQHPPICLMPDDMCFSAYFYSGSLGMLIVQEWCHIKSVKRAGWGHDPAGIAGTRPGELAVPC
ncbi:hypothetical protein L208DRAFT_1243108 [Tricholoma matsutake]|nr:hypothetical protein L208DRAFT_1243108 [Tricholoma matsutake 945]